MINDSKIKKNALRNEARRKYGSKAFKKNGDLKVEYIKLMRNSKNELTRKRAQLALNFRRMSKK